MLDEEADPTLCCVDQKQRGVHDAQSLIRVTSIRAGIIVISVGWIATGILVSFDHDEDDVPNDDEAHDGLEGLAEHNLGHPYPA